MDDQHRVLRESMGAFLVGGLPADEHAAVSEHLAGCVACRTEAADLEPVVRALRRSALAVPPVDLEERVVARVRAAMATSDATGTLPPSRSEVPVPISRARPNAPPNARPGNGRRLLAAAALIAIFAVGVGVGWAVFRAPAAAPTEPVAFANQAAGVTADGVLIAHTWGTEANLVITGLRQDERYDVVFVAADGSEVDGGTFIGISGRLVCKVNAAVLREDVTLLRVTDSTGAEVLTADLAS